MYMTILAQSNAWGNERAQSMLSDSLELTRTTALSWERIWETTLNPAAPLWQSLLYLGGLIFYICLILQAIQTYKEGALFLRELFIKVGISALFLVGDGYITVNLLKLMQAISQFFTSLVLRYTLADIRISEAIGSIQNTSAAKARTSEIFAECVDKIGTAFDQCINDPVKLERATELLNSLSDNAPLQGNILEQFVNGVISNLTAVVTLPVLSGMQMISNIIQWCFMNIYESAALGAALFFPIYLGLTLMPRGNVSLGSWFADYTKLLLFPIAYTAIIGFVAVVIAGTEQQGLPVGATFVDIAYSLFISIFAPILAWVGINKGATGLYESTVSAAKTSAETGVTAISAGANLSAKIAQIKALGG